MCRGSVASVSFTGSLLLERGLVSGSPFSQQGAVFLSALLLEWVLVSGSRFSQLLFRPSNKIRSRDFIWRRNHLWQDVTPFLILRKLGFGRTPRCRISGFGFRCRTKRHHLQGFTLFYLKRMLCGEAGPGSGRGRQRL